MPTPTEKGTTWIIRHKDTGACYGKPAGFPAFVNPEHIPPCKFTLPADAVLCLHYKMPAVDTDRVVLEQHLIPEHAEPDFVGKTTLLQELDMPARPAKRPPEEADDVQPGQAGGAEAAPDQ